MNTFELTSSFNTTIRLQVSKADRKVVKKTRIFQMPTLKEILKLNCALMLGQRRFYILECY